MFNKSFILISYLKILYLLSEKNESFIKIDKSSTELSTLVILRALGLTNKKIFYSIKNKILLTKLFSKNKEKFAIIKGNLL